MPRPWKPSTRSSRPASPTPGKASNAGGVAVSGLEMSQNAMRLRWSEGGWLHGIMQSIHRPACLLYGEEQGRVNYVKGEHRRLRQGRRCDAGAGRGLRSSIGKRAPGEPRFSLWRLFRGTRAVSRAGRQQRIFDARLLAAQAVQEGDDVLHVVRRQLLPSWRCP